jgi:hypothetical protein
MQRLSLRKFGLWLKKKGMSLLTHPRFVCCYLGRRKILRLYGLTVSFDRYLISPSFRRDDIHAGGQGRADRRANVVGVVDGGDSLSMSHRMKTQKEKQGKKIFFHD